METPDITPIQKLAAGAVALLGSALAVATAFGLDLSTAQIAAILGCATQLASFAVLADAIIRNGRARIAANPEALAMISKPGAPALND